MLVKVAGSAAHKYSSIAVIGGGIGGLSVANAALLHRKNLVHRVSVYEKASHFMPTAGAGFGFSPNGQICLSSIGIDGYHQVYHPFDQLPRINAEGTEIQQESDIFRQLRQKHGFGVAGCLQADIIDLVMQHLDEYFKAPPRPIWQYSQYSQYSQQATDADSTADGQGGT
jgi:2-polyprenyl-6-methoxyphenol hydroxylase-like FAD-dependent oxidoreductase